jgi:hypothetical protein
MVKALTTKFVVNPLQQGVYADFWRIGVVSELTWAKGATTLPPVTARRMVRCGR